MCQGDYVAVDSPSSLRLQLTVDCRTRFARPMVYNMSSEQDCATREKHASITHASQRRGKSVSDGFSRASLRVFAVISLASLAIRRRSLTEHGYVPVRSSEQDCATRENLLRLA